LDSVLKMLEINFKKLFTFVVVMVVVNFIVENVMENAVLSNSKNIGVHNIAQGLFGYGGVRSDMLLMLQELRHGCEEMG
jgi:hypothetical protein